ncbi:hypothetical protein K502DRAFT_369121 [Neoconidiobolus thromboides FSU 785]|nr:hypothetical protein K502DRAFT_369121 [Neoconidiobolus thromboides FSU 785]
MKLINSVFLLSLSGTVLTANLPSDKAFSPLKANDSYKVESISNNLERENGTRNYSKTDMVIQNSNPGFNNYSNRQPKDTKEYKDVSSYIGKKLIQEGGSITDPNTNIIFDKDLPKPNRIITPNTLGVTMDYVEDRLNVVVDEDYIITKIYYG